jgi:hypothetical protein
VLIVMKIVGWAQCVSGGSLGLGMEAGQSLCLWLVTVVNSWEGGQVSIMNIPQKSNFKSILNNHR